MSSPEPTLLRIALPDRRGNLALIASRLAAAGIDILRVEVVSADGTTAIDDVLVRGENPERALEDLHPAVQLLASRERGVLPDPGLAMADACASFAHARSLPAARQHFLRAALDLVGAERGALLWHAGKGWLRPVASTAGHLPPVHVDDFPAAAKVLRGGEAVLSTGDLDWAPAQLAEALTGGASAILHVGEPTSLLLCVVREDWFPFVSAELERLHAVSRVAAGLLRSLGERRTQWREAEPAAAS
jgi:hypothetical protein